MAITYATAMPGRVLIIRRTYVHSLSDARVHDLVLIIRAHFRGPRNVDTTIHALASAPTDKQRAQKKRARKTYKHAYAARTDA